MYKTILFLCLLGILGKSYAQTTEDYSKILLACFSKTNESLSKSNSRTMYVMDYNVDFPKAFKETNSPIQLKTRGELRALGQKEFFVFKDFTITGSKAVLNFSYYSDNPGATITSYHLVLQKNEDTWLITDYQVN